MAIHIYTANKKERVRHKCPYHKHPCYGTQHEYYDTVKVFFDCGTVADYGYGYHEPPRLYKNIHILKDDEGYTVLAPSAGWKMLACKVSIGLAHRIGKARLAKGGKIKDCIKDTQ